MTLLLADCFSCLSSSLMTFSINTKSSSISFSLSTIELRAQPAFLSFSFKSSTEEICLIFFTIFSITSSVGQPPPVDIGNESFLNKLVVDILAPPADVHDEGRLQRRQQGGRQFAKVVRDFPGLRGWFGRQETDGEGHTHDYKAGTIRIQR